MQSAEAPTSKCPECGAPLEYERSCRDYFHELLALEWQIPGAPGGEPHLFAVGTYNLQHPSGFVPAALAELCRTLADVLAGRATVDDALQRARRADGSTRVRRHADSVLSEEDRRLLNAWPTRWSMTVRDVRDTGLERYEQSVRAWAATTVEALSERLDHSTRHARRGRLK